MGIMWNINPKKRRKSRGKRRAKRTLSAAQVAAGFGGGKKTRRSRKRRARKSAASPVQHRAVRRSRRRASSGKRSRRSGGGGFSRSDAVAMLKSGVIGGVGAVAGDIMMGQASKLLQQMGMAAYATPTDATGQPNYGYYGVKAALLLMLGLKGNRLPVVGPYASRMAEGGLTVLAYQFIRPIAAQSLPLGYLNPAPTMRPQIGRSYANPYIAGHGGRNYIAGNSGVGAYVSAYASLPVRSGSGGSNGKGARAASVLSMVSRAG